MPNNTQFDANVKTHRTVATFATENPATSADIFTKNTTIDSAKNVSKIQLIIAVLILIGSILSLYLYMQKRTTIPISEPIPVTQPVKIKAK